MTASRVLEALTRQHDTLRGHMERCDQLADTIERDGGDPIELTREVARLRIAFEDHNAYEERLLRPMLLARDALSATRIDRVIADHVVEHRAVGARLSAAPAIAELRDVIDRLRAHLDAEERYLLDVQVLRAGRG